MNEIIINNTSLGVKEYKGRRVVTFRDIDTVHHRPEGTAKKRFNDNKKHFVEGVDYFKICASEIRTNKIMDISPKTHSDVILITESGYYMLVKSFTDDLSWDVQRELTNCYFKVQQNQADYSSLSPQLQFMIQIEQKQKKLESAVKTANRRIDSMCETMQVRGDNWRKDTKLLINRIVSATGEDYGDVYLDIYNTIEYRASCDLTRQLNNLRKRLYARGIPEYQIDKLNRVDVIANDKKLTEIYIATVKEMAIKCNIWKNERKY